MKKLTAILLAVMCILSLATVSGFAANEAAPAMIKTVKSTVTANSASISWEAAENATGYRVYMWNTAAKKWEIGLKATASLGIDISNLKPGTAYAFAIRPYRNTGEKIIWCEKYTKVTITTAPQSVSVVKAAPVANGIRLAWTKAQGAKGYRVYMYNPTAKTWRALKTTYNLSLDVTGLTAGTKYIFAVKPYAKAAGITTWAKTYTTVKTAAKPDAPAAVKCVSATSSSVKLSWTKSAGATGYRIYIWNNTSKAWSVVASVVTSQSATIGSLSPSRTYIFAVRPFVNTGSSIVWGNYTKVSATTADSSGLGGVINNVSHYQG